MLCFHSPKYHKAWKMRNRITAHWKFIDRADPENTNNYLNWNLTSFSQLTGSHACSPLCPCLPAEMYNWAKGVISKKQVLYYWDRDGTLTFPDGCRGIWEDLSPQKHLSLQPITILWTDIRGWFLYTFILSFPLLGWLRLMYWICTNTALCGCHAKYRMESCTDSSFREMAI